MPLRQGHPDRPATGPLPALVATAQKMLRLTAIWDDAADISISCAHWHNVINSNVAPPPLHKKPHRVLTVRIEQGHAVISLRVDEFPQKTATGYGPTVLSNDGKLCCECLTQLWQAAVMI
eukprot:CAMPEP_0172755146 /NCGR_PEP_ID=MMETSP1074-20121228/159310_1 /TAXON_ID=2916 /ORGANISM="Ceratium fusus, Strain PA161109" /LENGTH=119 /DNA_ID=CAMNT_0013588191 /DNA_START=118 /DNA_END=478 /DNA_ORIENTATION=+